jgi:hypothetical protein
VGENCRLEIKKWGTLTRGYPRSLRREKSSLEEVPSQRDLLSLGAGGAIPC